MAVRRKSALWTEFVTIISLVHIWDRRIGYRKVDQHGRVNVRTRRNRHTNHESSFEEDPDPAEVIKVVVSMPGYHMTWNLQLILAPPHFPMNTFCNLRNAVVFVPVNIHHPFSYMDPSGLTVIPYWRKTTSWFLSLLHPFVIFNVSQAIGRPMLEKMMAWYLKEGFKISSLRTRRFRLH